MRTLKSFVEDHGFKFLVGIFVSLCLLHFFSQRPLWNDEQAVFENIRDFSYGELFSVLKSDQVFPRVHLAVIKFISGLFNGHVLSLRFPSLVFMMAAFGVWIKLYRQDFSKGLFLLSVMAFALSFRMSYYAAELKPYAMDVLAVGLFLLYFQHQGRLMAARPMWADYLLALVMPAFIFFSYASIFVFWIASFNFFLLSLGNRKFWGLFVLSFLSAVLCFGVDYRIDLAHSVTHPGIQGYWQDYFIQTSSLKGFFEPIGEGFQEIATWWHGNGRMLSGWRPPLFLVFFILWSVLGPSVLGPINFIFFMRNL